MYPHLTGPGSGNIRNSEHFCRELLRRFPGARLCVIAATTPAWALEHTGPLLCVTREAPAKPFRSGDFGFLRGDSSAEALAALRTARARHAGGFDIIFIDHDHRLPALVAQVNAALPLAHAKTVFLFDDAVPPTIGMAGPEPTQGWWVGEVWMLAHMLAPEGPQGRLLTCALPPTGLMVAAGFAPIDPAAVDRTRAAMAGVTTDAALAEVSSYTRHDIAFDAACELLQAELPEDEVRVVPSTGHEPLPRRILVPQQAWLKPPPAFVCNLSSHGLDPRRLFEAQRHTHAKMIDSFEDATLLGFGAIIKDGRYFHRYVNSAELMLARLADGFGGYSNEATGLHRFGDAVVLPRERLEDPVVLDMPVLFGTPEEPHNWGMWLLIGLPSAAEFLANRDRYGKFLCYAEQPWQRRLLEMVGIGPAELIRHDVSRSYRCSALHLIRHSARDLFVTADERAIFAALADRIARPPATGTPEKLFISRLTRTRKLGAYRGMTNEEALIEGLQHLGFVAVEPEYLPFEEQVALFRNARSIVGLGGAAMFNTVFCRPGTRVVTIESTLTFVDAHTNIFGSLGLDYGVILGDEDLTDPRASQRRWSLDVPRALERIAAWS
ncbi:hypothetical protein GCM10011504_20250 [Siccirubricoccus deserti]|uniref:DUF563 domain-containing protein n=1 Tax=Siccirubricoccus deserti TaxID=2013562 RepID=A0A9X0UDD2_9PROT|nr:glycosyltransferase family 61 protein [Siccirubricoccus deserti]MBC4015448.1 DUF563 domain-containing protein [Siccirubricoccus deserti]GGC41765.1 hypothetical protein GCM10011504_20250 [Siccirubricoccus deserti]